MKELIFIIFTIMAMVSPAQNLFLDLEGKTLVLEDDFNQVYENVTIVNGILTTKASIKHAIPLRFDEELPEEDGLYVVAYGAFKSGGGYGTSKLFGTQLQVQIGTLVERKNSIWRLYNQNFGIRFTGNLYVNNVVFSDISWLGVFDFIGMKTNRKIEIKNSGFEYVRRVFTPDRITKHSQAGSLSQRTVRDGINYSFEEVDMAQNYFSNIYESIMWGSPTIKRLYFSNNIVEDSPHVATILNLLPSIYDLEKRAFYINNSRAYIFDNEIRNIASQNAVRSDMPRQLFRMVGNSHFRNNSIINFNGIPIYLSGGGSIIADNFIEGNINIQTRKHQQAIILFKISGFDISQANYVCNNVVTRTNALFIHWSNPQNFEVFNNTYQNFDYYESYKGGTMDKNTTYLKNGKLVFYNTETKKWQIKIGDNTTDAVYNFEQGKQNWHRLNFTLNSYNNNFKAYTLLRFTGGLGKQNLNININDTYKVVNLTSKKVNAKINYLK